MVDFNARSGYRGTVEFSRNSLLARRAASETSRGNETSRVSTKAAFTAASRQEVGASDGSRQVVATPPAAEDQSVGWSIFSRKDSGAMVTPTPAAPVAAAPAAAAPLTRAQSDAMVLQSLKDALKAAGVSFDGLGLAVHEDVVTYPGGSYLNRYISVNTNDHQEGLMTDLVAINPKVAVLDIKRMLGMA